MDVFGTAVYHFVSMSIFLQKFCIGVHKYIYRYIF